MRRVDRRSSAVLAALTVVVCSTPARAQSAEAEVLFKEGRQLIKQGKLAEGCDKIAASERSESSIGTLLNLGDCREKQGKLATAWAAFKQAEAMAKRAGNDEKRQSEALRRAEKLEPRLANLVIVVARPIEGLSIRRDVETIDKAAWNTALPVDPGTYTVAAEAPGYKPWHLAVTVAPGQKRQVVTVPALEPAPVITEPPAVREPEKPVVAIMPERIEHETVHVAHGTWTTTRQVAVVAGAAGALALGTGVYFGMRSRDLDNKANAICPDKACGDPQGLALNDQAKTAASRANILYAAGAASLATGLVLWFVGAPSGGTAVSASVSHDHAGVAYTGRF
jgi:hypothetical protein